jgi:hypothetical protein
VVKRGKNRGNTQPSRREEVERRAVYFGAHMCPGGGFFPPKSRWPGEWSGGWSFTFLFSFSFGENLPGGRSKVRV